jgi:hypothetical protein
MWFGVDCLDGGALQVMSWDAAAKMIRDSGVSDTSQLAGKACVVEVDDDQCTINFVRMFKKP